MTLKITTNHHWRPFVYRSDVPSTILASDFDYQNPEDAYDGFFKYKGHWYHLDQFMRVGYPFDVLGTLGEWQGVLNDSMCSGVLIRMSEDGSEYQIAWFCG